MTAEISALENPLDILAETLANADLTGSPRHGHGQRLHKQAQTALKNQDNAGALSVLGQLIAVSDYAQAIGWFRGYGPGVEAVLDRARLALQQNGLRPADLDLQYKLELERRYTQ